MTSKRDFPAILIVKLSVAYLGVFSPLFEVEPCSFDVYQSSFMPINQMTLVSQCRFHRFVVCAVSGMSAHINHA